MIFVILVMLLLGGYVAVSVFASYWLLLAIGVSAMSLIGLLWRIDYETGAGRQPNADTTHNVI
jgi:hypothetical protein